MSKPRTLSTDRVILEQPIEMEGIHPQLVFVSDASVLRARLRIAHSRRPIFKEILRGRSGADLRLYIGYDRAGQCWASRYADTPSDALTAFQEVRDPAKTVFGATWRY
jgi:hypothetical protein